MTGELGVTGSNPTPTSTFFLLFLKIYLEDFNNVKVYILEKKLKKNKKIIQVLVKLHLNYMIKFYL